MTSTLLVFSHIPESVEFYIIPNDVADKFRTQFELAHNKLINCDEMNEGMHFINHAIIDESYDQKYEEYTGIFRQYKIDRSNFDLCSDVNVTRIVNSGFVL